MEGNNQKKNVIGFYDSKLNRFTTSPADTLIIHQRKSGVLNGRAPDQTRQKNLTALEYLENNHIK